MLWHSGMLLNRWNDLGFSGGYKLSAVTLRMHEVEFGLFCRGVCMKNIIRFIFVVGVILLVRFLFTTGHPLIAWGIMIYAYSIIRGPIDSADSDFPHMGDCCECRDPADAKRSV